MASCTKCGVTVDTPVKVWKVKQTSMGLFECPSCKMRWRGRLAEAQTFKPAVNSKKQPKIAEQFEDAQSAKIMEKINDTIKAIETIKPIETVETIPENNAEPSDRPAGPFSGLKTFFSFVLYDILSE